MKVVVYLPSYSMKQRTILRCLLKGIPGATSKMLEDFVPGEADVGVIFGWWKTAYPPTMAKRPIIEHYGSRLLMVESAFVRRGVFYQVGWGGFAGHADFRSDEMPDDRWRDLGVRSKPWQRRPFGPMVVIGQLPRDTQVQEVDHAAWCRKAVRHYQNRGVPVIFRPHPRCREPGVYQLENTVRFDTRKLRKTLSEARAVVTWNSTTGVEAAIAGVPVIACDRGAMAWPVASYSLKKSLRYPSRRSWLASLGYSQWTLKEMKEGLPWSHLAR